MKILTIGKDRPLQRPWAWLAAPLVYLVFSAVAVAAVSKVGVFTQVISGSRSTLLVAVRADVTGGQPPYTVTIKRKILSGSRVIAPWETIYRETARSGLGFGRQINEPTEATTWRLRVCATDRLGGRPVCTTKDLVLKEMGMSGPSGTYQTLHTHVGCTRPSNACNGNQPYHIRFTITKRVDGKIQVDLDPPSITLVGDLNGTDYVFTYNGYGRGRFSFSPDFSSFTGTFEDDNGHRGKWTGNK